MRLHSVVNAITNSSSELFVVEGDLSAARREFEDLWDAWREGLPEGHAWKGFLLGDFLQVDERGWTVTGDPLEVLALSYGLPRPFREGLQRSALRHSKYLDG